MPKTMCDLPQHVIFGTVFYSLFLSRMQYVLCGEFLCNGSRSVFLFCIFETNILHFGTLSNFFSLFHLHTVIHEFISVYLCDIAGGTEWFYASSTHRTVGRR
jgi:hypothetical protein